MTGILRAGDDMVIALNGIPYAKVLAAKGATGPFTEGLTHIEGKIQ